MTNPSSWFKYKPKRILDLHATKIDLNQVSVVIPVRDNQKGLNALLRSLKGLSIFPKEIIIVDNLSRPKVTLSEHIDNTRIVHCNIPGPAAARNAGARVSVGDWIWFLDSDCTV